MNQRVLIAGTLLLAAAAFAWRAPALSLRPMHGDEARDAYTLGILLETGRYVYNPREFHGPSLYFLSVPVVLAQGKQTFASLTERDVRLVTVLAGVGLILLLPLVADGLGRGAALAAGAVGVFCPAFVFYDRYFIHESPLVFFTFATIAAGWRYLLTGKAGWAAACGASLGMMHATKETCVVAVGCMAAAMAVEWVVARRASSGADSEILALAVGSHPTTKHVGVRSTHVLIAAVVAAVVSVLLFSAFFTNLRGPLDSILTYRNYFGRGAGAGADAAVHVRPWDYYVKLLVYTRYGSGPVWTEGLIVLLALVGSAAAAFDRLPAGASRGFVRFVGVYTLLVFAAYSALPYKTPWLVLTPLHGMILLAGVGAAALLRAARAWPLKIVVGLLLAAGVAHQAVESHRANFRFRADRRNPWVYAHTSVDVLRLASRIDELAGVSPQGRHLLVRVIADYSWPLPWYLRGYDRVGYWEHVPSGSEAGTSVFIVSADLAPDLESRLKGKYQTQHYGFRPDVLMLVYIRQDLWDRMMEKRQGR